MKPVIPEAALGQHIAVLGKTGAGKTFAVKGIVEQLLGAARRVGIVDPTGAWWGLRSSHDGKGPGFPILVLGGDHGDLPLPALGGAAVARLLVEQSVNLVADTSQLTVGERTRWFIDFATTLHRLNRSPLHLVMDEAHMFAPQGKVPDPDTGKMLHAANTLASGGRSRGIRLVMITQRPQKLHKDALTSADTLIAMRVLAPQDRLAVEDWIKGCGDLAQGKEVLNSLASLQRGEGWVWYPEGGHLARVKFPPITTFDSSATPTDGHAVATPRGAAEIDLSEIRNALADAVKEAEANDPKLLRAEIARLKADAGKQAHPQIDRAALADADMRGRATGYAEALRALLPIRDRLQTVRMALDEQLGGLLDDLARWEKRIGPAAASGDPRDPNIPERANPSNLSGLESLASKFDAPYRSARVKSGGRGNPEVGTGGLRRMMIALAQRPQGLTRRALGVRAGMSSGSGTFATYLAKARTGGWVNGDATTIRITESGVQALGDYDPLPTGRELLAYWLGELGNGGASRLLRAVADAYPRGLSRDQAAAAADLSAASGTFATYLAKLRTLELVTGRSELQASEDLFQ